MDFDLDDQMDSDDSFFEEPKVLSKRSSLTKTPEKKSIDSLFGLSEKTTLDRSDANTAEKKSMDSLFGLPDKTSTEKLLKTDTEKSKPTVTFDDTVRKVEFKPSPKVKDDWLNDGDPTSMLDKTTKKTDFLDDILSIKPKSKSEKKSTSLEDILRDSKAVQPSLRVSNQPKEMFTPTESTSDLGLMASARGRRRRGSSTGIEDALGLFGDDYQSGDFYSKDKSAKPTETTTKSKDTPDKNVPDWLGGSSTSVNKIETPTVTKSELIDTLPTKQEDPLPTASNKKAESLPNLLDPQMINTSIQNTYSSLHQQESFLLVSLQLKKYEESLAELKNQQKELLGKQEKHLSTFFEEYLLKQQMVENNIRLQQERINNQIQMLLTNPSGKPTGDVEHHNVKSERSNENELQFQSFVKSLKQRHEEEMFMMEESYKKQLNILEASTMAMETTLKADMANLAQSFEDKLNSHKEKYEEEINYYKEKLKLVEEQHQDEFRILKENHARVVQDVKSDYAMQLENIKEMKQRESELMNSGQVFSQKLDVNIETLSNNTKALQNMEDKLMQTHDLHRLTRESSLQAKEQEILLMRSNLEKCREAAESERAQLLVLVRNLEAKLAEQSNNGREDRWALQQASATLTARAAAIEREAEFNRTTIEREREELKTLKESLLAQQEKMVMQLTEEKLQFTTEKARWETSSKLTNTYENERLKSEAETAIQVARELTEKVNQERAQLQRQRHETETMRKTLIDRERELDEKESELEMLAQDAQRKLRDDKKILLEAKRMENMYKERLQELHNQWTTLSNREKRLAEEKVSLSKERLALYTSMKTPKSCVLCKTDERPPYENFIPAGSQDILLHKISDVDTMRLKVDALDDESVVSKEENHISVSELLK